MPIYWFVFGILGAIIFIALWQSITYVYKCEKCSRTFQKPFWSNLISPFRYGGFIKNNKRYFKCPHCNKYGWCKIVEQK